MPAPLTRSRTFSALGYCFEVTVEGNDALAAHVPELFAALAGGTGDPARWQARDAGGEEGATRWELVVDGTRQVGRASAACLVAEMVHTLNQVAIPAWDGVVCHAGGVARHGAGIVLPADMESGKTTLTAGLVRAGFEYLSDEGVAFWPGTTTIEPYPKPLSIDPGSWFLFPELEPHGAFDDDDYKKDQWQVAPDAIRAGAVGGPCPARLIVFPKYVEGADTTLAPLRRAEALVTLAKNTFSFNANARVALEELAGVVRAVDCYELTVGDLDDAVAQITELVDALVPAHGRDV